MMYVESHLRSLRDRLLALRSLPGFKGLRDETLLEIGEHARERRFRRGERLLAADVPVDRLYIVFAGKVLIDFHGAPLLTVDGNGSVGFLSVIAGVPLGWSAVAEADTLTLEVPASAFLASLEEEFPLLRAILRVVAGLVVESRGNLPVASAGAPPPEQGTMPERDPTLVERIIMLRTGRSLFATANMDALIELCRRMTWHRVEEGHVFFQVGDPSSFSMRINAGLVRCTAANGDHVDVGSEMVLGAMDAFADRPRSYAARALTPVSYSSTDRESFLAVIEMHPMLAMNMLRAMARGLIPAR